MTDYDREAIRQWRAAGRTWDSIAAEYGREESTVRRWFRKHSNDAAPKFDDWQHPEDPDWREWLTLEGLHNCVISTDELTPEQLVDFCDRARRRFYLRPRYILRKLWRSLIDPDERRRTFKAFSTFRRYIFRSSRRR